MKTVIFLIILYFIIAFGLFFVIDRVNTKRLKELQAEKEAKIKAEGYVRPQLKEITQEQIDNIHARGKITPAEKIKEWEGLDLCAPGDAIGSAAWRCKKFHYNCHDCLVDYANNCNEYESVFNNLKIVNKY